MVSSCSGHFLTRPRSRRVSIQPYVDMRRVVTSEIAKSKSSPCLVTSDVHLNPEKLIVITIDIVKLLSLSLFFLSSYFFPFSGFSRNSLCLRLAFSVIWLHPLPYFGAWIDFLGITHYIWCFHWEVWSHTRGLSVKIPYSLLRNYPEWPTWLHRGRVSTRLRSIPSFWRKRRKW